MVGDAAGQGFGRLTQEIGGCAAQNEKAASRARLIDENAQTGKKLWSPVYLVQYDKAFQGPEGEEWVRKQSEILGTLKIKERRGAAATADELTGEGGLADLAWTEDRHNWKLAQQGRERMQVVGSLDHARIVP